RLAEVAERRLHQVVETGRSQNRGGHRSTPGVASGQGRKPPRSSAGWPSPFALWRIRSETARLARSVPSGSGQPGAGGGAGEGPVVPPRPAGQVLDLGVRHERPVGPAGPGRGMLVLLVVLRRRGGNVATRGAVDGGRFGRLGGGQGRPVDAVRRGLDL